MKYLNTYNESLEETFREVNIPTMWADCIYYEGVMMPGGASVYQKERNKVFKKYLNEVFKNKIVEFKCDGQASSNCRISVEDSSNHFTKLVGAYHRGLVQEVRFTEGVGADVPYVGFVIEGLGKWLHGVDEKISIKVFGKIKRGKIEQTVESEREGSKFGI